MFDPERDEDSGARPFYLRLFVVAAITAAAGLVLWPAVTGFSAGPDHLTGCLAITDGWHADKSAPSAAENLQISSLFPLPPTAAQRNDPASMAQWRAQVQVAQANPVVQHAYAYADWIVRAGACVHESRHRLIRSGIGLLGLVGFVGGVALVRRTRTNLRRVPAELAGT